MRDIVPVVVRWIHVRPERNTERLPKQIVIIGDTAVSDRYRYAFDHAALFLWVGKPRLSPGGNLLAVAEDALAFVEISISHSKFLSVVHHLFRYGHRDATMILVAYGHGLTKACACRAHSDQPPCLHVRAVGSGACAGLLARRGREAPALKVLMTAPRPAAPTAADTPAPGHALCEHGGDRASSSWGPSVPPAPGAPGVDDSGISGFVGLAHIRAHLPPPSFAPCALPYAMEQAAPVSARAPPRQ